MKHARRSASASVYIVVAVVVIILGFLFFLSRREKEDPTLVVFAKCLTGKGVAMYGADWCSHCQNEKNRFGSAFSYVNYKNCGNDPQVCIAAKVDVFPTWVFPGGERLVGEQELDALARASGCTLGAQK